MGVGTSIRAVVCQSATDGTEQNSDALRTDAGGGRYSEFPGYEGSNSSGVFMFDRRPVGTDFGRFAGLILQELSFHLLV